MKATRATCTTIWRLKLAHHIRVMQFYLLAPEYLAPKPHHWLPLVTLAIGGELFPIVI